MVPVRPRFERAIRRWLWIASILCLLASLLTPLVGARLFLATMILPMINCVAVAIALFVRSWHYSYDESSRYIKERYPQIWKKLHPWGDLSYNPFAADSFMDGRYDDGTDLRLNAIKLGLWHIKLFSFWAFLLIPATWAIVVPLHLIGSSPHW